MTDETLPPDPIRAARDEVLSHGVRPADSKAPGERAGDLIGRYKLLEQIGEGGMGTVWMAEQKEPVKRRVALKIIKLGMDTKQVVARFEAERQALAMMDHPHIAKVLDAGATATGRPYFVMEYIKGIPILEYCDHEKIDTKTRLGLFTSVCHAIQHAHQKGIIHRDIKPTNVLVTMHDGVPVTKVIDFGIAKATNSELTTKTLFTEHRQMVGTPAYMSPEQAEMSGLDIDTRSDIYSLGVLLYELLTGTTPFDIQDLMAKGFAEMMRTIREVEPHKPSTRISSLGDTGTRTALERRVDLKKLGTLLRGDLDWIVMKCLEKDRTRRYETANGLAADIKRHLANEPVSAGAPSASYRLRKFVKRNRLQVMAGGAVVAALLLGVVGFAWQAQEASDQRDQAVLARNSEAQQRQIAEAARVRAEEQHAIAVAQEAEATKQAAEARKQAALAKEQEAEARKHEAEAKKQATIANAVAKFQTQMLAAVDPNLLPKDPVTQKSLKDAVTVLQAMQAAVKLLDEGALKDQPLVEVGVRGTIGDTLFALGRYDEAEPNLRKALEIARAVHPTGALDIAEGLNRVARLLHVENKLAEAELLFRECQAIRFAALPAAVLDYATCVDNLACLLKDQHRLGEAEPLHREALAIRRSQLPAGHDDIAYSLNNLAVLLQLKNELAAAEPLYREALAIRRTLLPAGHPGLGFLVTNLAMVLHQQDKPAEAEPLYREALEIYRGVLPAGHPDIAGAMFHLAAFLREQNRFAEAEPLFLEALEISRGALPVGHPDIARRLDGLGVLRWSQGKFAEAERLFREALAIERAALPAGHPILAMTVANLACALRDQNKLAEAEPLFREALASSRAAHPARHPVIGGRLSDLARLLQTQGRLAEAEPLCREALEIERATLRAGHPKIATSLDHLAQVLQAQDKLAEAEPLYREALEIRRATLPAAHPAIAHGLGNIAGILRARGKLAEAESLSREALDVFRMALPAGHAEMALPLNNLGMVLFEQKRLAEAEPLLREALAIDRKALPKAHPDLVAGSLKLGNLLKDMPGRERAAEAEALLREALTARRALAPEPADLALILGNVANLCWKQGKFDQSVPLYEELLQREEAAHGRGHPDTLMAVANLGVNYKDAGRLAEATPLLEEAYHASKQVPSLAFVGTQLLDAYARVADPQQPETIARVMTLVEELLVIARTGLAKDCPELADRLALIGERLLRSRANVHAEPLWVEIAAVMRRVYPGDHAEVALALNNLGYLRVLLGRAAEAKDVLAEALAMRRRLHAGDHLAIATTLSILGSALHALGENGAARASYDEALAMGRRLEPDGSAMQAEMLWQLAKLDLAEGNAAQALPKLEECVAMVERRMGPATSRLAAYRETLAKCKAAMSGGK